VEKKKKKKKTQQKKDEEGKIDNRVEGQLRKDIKSIIINTWGEECIPRTGKFIYLLCRSRFNRRREGWRCFYILRN